MSPRRFTEKYDDIINLSRPVSEKHRPMPLADRAAQFAPFAALTGHGEAVKETARLTETRVEMDEYEKEILRGQLQQLADGVQSWNAAGLPVEERPAVIITYFVPDALKEGGAYVTASGQVKKFDQYLRQIVLKDDGGEWQEIPLDEIIRVEGEIFRIIVD